MNNSAEPEGRRDAEQSRKPRTQQQKNSEFFEKLEQLEQKWASINFFVTNFFFHYFILEYGLT